MFEAFGYRDDDRKSVALATFNTAEAKADDTLQPLVVLYLRFFIDSALDYGEITLNKATDLDPELVATFAAEGKAVTEQLAIPVDVDSAEIYAHQILDFVGRARQKDFHA